MVSLRFFCKVRQFKFGFVELFVCALPALFALSPLRGAPPKEEP